jgi:3-oxoacyl-[acyl-carrier protein] reductase
MNLGLQDRKVLVGGASRGLGAAIAGYIAAEGGRVALAARPSEALDRQAAAVGGVAIGVDLSTDSGPREAVDRTVAAFGGIDVLVVNGGGPPVGTFDELDDAHWHVAIEGTLMYPVRLIRTALPYLRASTAPAVLLILSSSVRQAIPALDTSNTLRPALAGLLKSLATQLAPIRVNGIAPGRISTDRIAKLDADRAKRRGTDVETVYNESVGRIPLGRYGDPAEVGAIAAVLCSRAASYVTGTIVPVDGGLVSSLP